MTRSRQPHPGCLDERLVQFAPSIVHIPYSSYLSRTYPSCHAPAGCSSNRIIGFGSRIVRPMPRCHRHFAVRSASTAQQLSTGSLLPVAARLIVRLCPKRRRIGTLSSSVHAPRISLPAKASILAKPQHPLSVVS